ncbi:hypothetical protein [Streptomyces olivochromogenes]|uniref:hypothetical protein n=1 Tax=Streptomyces olivochromogenes TaxID=1963 RepID=UPI001F474667|nr:hypothetical protein [Streptomyces olivochromogenes]MCF3128820.1 hypothetical protein [Streptomyces olivochromogenes]
MATSLTRQLYRAFLVASSAGLTVALSTATASASGQVTVQTGSPRSEAARVNYWSSTDDFRVSDTKCDGNDVYAQYRRTGASTRTLRNSLGCGSHVDFDRTFTGRQNITYRICVDDAGGDTCSPWHPDHT